MKPFDPMKSASEWNDYHKQICFNDPAVHGQLLPNPQMVEFIKKIQTDAMKEGMRRAAEVAGKNLDWATYHDVISAAEQLTEKDT